MITFWPYEDPASNAIVLDQRRLGKQILETQQILDCLDGRLKRHHPIVTMWRGCESGLHEYGRQLALEWKSRTGNDHGGAHFLQFDDPMFPDWTRFQPLLDSHKQVLLSKDSEYYGSIFPGTQPLYRYLWWHPSLGYYYGQLSQLETIRLYVHGNLKLSTRP